MFTDHYGTEQTYHEKALFRDCCNHMGEELYPIQTIFNHHSRDQLREFCMSFYKLLVAGTLSKGISSTLNFEERFGLPRIKLATSCTKSNHRID